MERTPYSVAVCGDSSVLILTHATLPAYSDASSSTSGAIMRHGPHHGALPGGGGVVGGWAGVWGWG